MDPSLLAKAAGPGYCSEAAGMPSSTNSRLRECILLLQIKKCKQKKMKKGRCKDVLMGQLRTFSNYFLDCGGVQTDPCIRFFAKWN